MSFQEKTHISPLFEVISSTAKFIGSSSANLDIKTILSRSVEEDASSCTIIRVNSLEYRVLVISPVSSGASHSFTEAQERLQRALLGELSSRPVDFTFWVDKRNHGTSPSPQSYLALLAPLSDSSLCTNLVVFEESKSTHKAAGWTDGSLSSPTSLRKLGGHYLLSIFLTVVLFIVLVFSTYKYEFTNDTHIQYDVGDSIGPKYTALLSTDNVTEWAEKHYDPKDWAIRIDDQALVPIELMDEQEWRYQEYLSKRYPEKAEFRDSGAWADPDFLKDPNNFMLQTDMQFHTGHCIRAIRRYWQAKETGRHVCPWDIDYLHLRHCFTMLEEVMLPPGPMELPADPKQPMSMSWRAKVCMWEEP